MATTLADTEVEFYGPRLQVSPPGIPDPGGPDEVELAGRRIPVNPPGTPDPGGGDTDVVQLGQLGSISPQGPRLPTDGDTLVEIHPGTFSVSPGALLPVADPPDTRILTGLNLLAPEDVELFPGDPNEPGKLFDRPIEFFPDGSAGDSPIIPPSGDVKIFLGQIINVGG